MYGEGISHESELLDLAVKLEIIQKSGAWFSYQDNRIGQGRDNAKEYLKNNPEMAAEVEKLVRENLSQLTASPRAKAAAKAPVEIPIAAAPISASAAKAQIDIVVDDD